MWNAETLPTQAHQLHTHRTLSPLPHSWLSHLCNEKCFSTCVMSSLRALYTLYIRHSASYTHTGSGRVSATCSHCESPGLLFIYNISLCCLFTLQVNQMACTCTHTFVWCSPRAPETRCIFFLSYWHKPNVVVKKTAESAPLKNKERWRKW